MDDDWEYAEPRAGSLIEAMRGFGYSPEAAVADLVDNSISAQAKNVAIEFEWAGKDSTVRILDDGNGMSEKTLVNAMRLGSASPLEDRAPSDLGRFGLGLKTASFSQARELSVVSRNRKGSPVAIRRWDLDSVESSGEWRLHTTPPQGKELKVEWTTGTTVQWSNLDRLVGSVDVKDKKAHTRFLDMIDRVHSHLEGTFERFLTGRGRVRITVNGKPVEPWDPFMLAHPATQTLDEEELPFKGELIRVRPYVLPHRSKLTDSEARRGAGEHGWNHQQGFYLYRSGRLLVQGDWLGLGIARDEHTKLARIAIDFPASLDHDWQVDVRKSTARPPGQLAESLKRVAQATRRKAEEVYRHRGKVLARKSTKSFVFAWQQYKDRDGQIRYKVNRDHPVINTVLTAAGKERPLVERALRFIEETVPTTLIGVEIAHSLDSQPAPFGQAKREITPLAKFVIEGLMNDGASVEQAFAAVAASEPFSQHPEVLSALKEKMQ